MAIPTTTTDRQIVSNTDGERIGMSVDNAMMGHIMRVLTNMYKDPQMACVREYSTNARDSHIMAGRSGEPIKVITPTALHPFLIIEDFGLGLSPDDIREIYSRYGSSTKRESNEVNGMLGIGCKSALAYTDQFTLVGTKDGIRQQVLISRDASGGGTMEIVSTVPTAEPNGVKVVIPAKTGSEFELRARYLFSFWEKGTVLLNCEDPTGFGGKLIDTGIYTRERAHDVWLNNAATKDVVVMGGVPYPVTLDLQQRLAHGHQIVAYAPIGSLEPSPDREGLIDTPQNSQFLAALTDCFYAKLDEAALKAVDSAPTKPEALSILRVHEKSLRSNFANRLSWTWQGRRIPEMFEIPKDQTVLSGHVSSGWGSSTSALSSMATTALANQTVIVYNYTGKWNALRQRKLTSLLNQAGQQDVSSIKVWLFSYDPRKQLDGWVENERYIAWEDVRAVKLPPSTPGVTTVTATGRLKGSYDVYDQDGLHHEVPADKLPGTNLFWAHGRYAAGAATHLLQREFKQYCVVRLESNRIEKFKRDFPHAQEYAAYHERRCEAWLKRVKANVRVQQALAVKDMGVANIVGRFDASRVEDPALKDAIELSNTPISGWLEERKALKSSAVGAIPTMTQNGYSFSMKKKYPLFDVYRHQDKEDLYLYFNAKHRSCATVQPKP